MIKIDIKKGVPPKDGYEYLVYFSSDMCWTFCSWFTSKQMFECSGERQAGSFIDRFAVYDITNYAKMDGVIKED